jgi:hypothetical protein
MILELDEGSLLPNGDAAPEETGRRGAARFASPPAAMVRSDKALSVWPLPGGGKVWKQSLDAMLRYVAESGPTLRDAIDWMLRQFDRVKSEKVARGYWQVPRSFGLMETIGERLALTADGALYLDSPRGEVLLGLLRESVAGFDELVAALEAGTLTTAEGLTLLNETLGVGWESDAQVKFRLGWLENLGVVVQRGGQWQLASNGPGTT